MGEPLPKATFNEAISRRGWLPHAFGKPLMHAVAEGYAFPTGERVATFISDSRMGEAEARKIDQLMNAISPGNRRRKSLSLFDSVGVTSFALANAIPTAQVIGVELDHETHLQGVHNIHLANLNGRVTLVEGNAVSYLESASGFDAIFVDPPWPDRKEGLSVADTTPKNRDIVSNAVEHSPIVVARVPLIADLAEIVAWPDRTEGFSDGKFSLAETTPNNRDIISMAIEHSPIVVARVPLIADVAEIVALNESMGTELFIDKFRIKESGAEPQVTLYFAKTGASGVSVRELMLESRSTVWNSSGYLKLF